MLSNAKHGMSNNRNKSSQSKPKNIQNYLKVHIFQAPRGILSPAFYTVNSVSMSQGR